MADDAGGAVGVVVAGAGVRGAYEIGALSILIPWLRHHGRSPRILVGTSAGAINTVLAATMCAASDPEEAAEQALALWRSIGRAQVFHSVLVTGWMSALRYGAGVAGLPVSLHSLLDPAPLRRLLDRYPHWDDVHRAVAGGRLDAVAVIASAHGQPRTDAFVELKDRQILPARDDVQGITYVSARLGPEHVMASAAIPVAFPPVAIEEGWYLDGGVRLNVPIKPALRLGATELLVVATHPLAKPPVPKPPVPRPDRPGPRPDVFAASALVLTAALVDRMVEDLHALRRINTLVAAGATDTGYRYVPHLFVGPEQPDSIAQVAEQVLTAKYDGVRGLFGGDYTVLNRLVGGPSRDHAELLSFLLFDPDYTQALIDLGCRDAAVAVTGMDGVRWQ